MNKFATGIGAGLSTAGALAGLYVAGAIGIHIKGPTAFIFWEMGLPAPFPNILWKLYGGWIFWFY